MAVKTPLPYINRELSWLEFNERLLDQVRDPALPLLERLKFLAISSSNLDEFFMVRVGGLQMLSGEGITKTDPSGLSPSEQLEAISERVHMMTATQHDSYLDDLEVRLADAKIRRIRPAELSEEQHRHVEYVFNSEIFPVLSPIAITPPIAFPLLANRALHIGVRLKGNASETEKPRYAIIPIGRTMSRFITLPSATGYQFMMIEDIIFLFVNRFFPGEQIVECVPFRVTRNADLSIREDLAFDLLAEMEAVLDARKRGDFVRLETGVHVTKTMLTFLQKALRITESDTYALRGPLDFSAFMKLTELPGYGSLKIDAWTPQPSALVAPETNMFDCIAKQDVLLLHPYESFEPVLRLINEAADDPDVITIKQILYRTSRNSPIVSALIRAAEKGKYVTALVELKARFDEERNIEWARELEDAGVQVLYGVKGLKTHAKLLLIIRRGAQGLVRFMHFGTGNYNEITAHMYGDISYMTSNEDLGVDASAFFNAITGYSQPQKYRKLEMAPVGLREKLLELIEAEAERKRQGQRAFIRAKMNSLADPKIIKGLYEASQAGVKIELNIRGICCLRPGIAGVSENITVSSIVDRYLEHSRILHCHHGGEDKIFIATADWMPRNLDRRIELLVPIEDISSRNRLIELLDICFRDTANSWKLLPDGHYERLRPAPRKKAVRCQETLYKQATSQNQSASQARLTAFEPYRPTRTAPPVAGK